MSFDPNKPYNDLPLLPPPVDLESKAVLKRAISANKALAELKGAGELIPNQLVLIQTLDDSHGRPGKSQGPQGVLEGADRSPVQPALLQDKISGAGWYRQASDGFRLSQGVGGNRCFAGNQKGQGNVLQNVKFLDLLRK